MLHLDLKAYDQSDALSAELLSLAGDRGLLMLVIEFKFHPELNLRGNLSSQPLVTMLPSQSTL